MADKIYYSLSSSDTNAILAALNILSDYELDSDNLIDFSILCPLTSQKLIQKEVLSDEDMYIIAHAVEFAHTALRGDFYLDDDLKSILQNYLFVYNKLYPLFHPFLG